MHLFPLCRFGNLLLFLGMSESAAREITITDFCQIIGEFALEYRTTRERVVESEKKKENHRKRNKTRGRMITEVIILRGCHSGHFGIVGGHLGFLQITKVLDLASHRFRIYRVQRYRNHQHILCGLYSGVFSFGPDYLFFTIQEETSATKDVLVSYVQKDTNGVNMLC